MPKLKNNEIEQITYISLNDYAKNVAKYERIEDKIKYTTRYLLNHDGKKDNTFEEAIQFARLTIGDAMAKSKDFSNLSANMFLSNPVDYIKEEASKLANDIQSRGATLKIEDNLKDNCIAIASYLKADEMNMNINNIANNKAFGVKTRLENKMGGKRELTKTLNDTKPGFFSRLFNTTSNQWKALDNAYKDFNNPESENYGNKDVLANAASAYIAHKIKGYKAGDLISEKTLNSFDKTSKAKLMFSLNVVSSVNEQKEIDTNYNQSLTNAQQKNVTYEQIENAPKVKVIDLDQIEF